MLTKNKNYKLAFAVLIITAAVYANSLFNNFIWDDEFLIVNNAFIKDWKYLPNIFTTHLFYFASKLSDYYRPLQSLSYMLDYTFWRLNPFGYHFTNLILHLGNTLLVFIFVNLLAKNAAISSASSLLFGIHPIQTSVVPYISSRADLMFVFFILLAFISYILNSRRENSPRFKLKFFLLPISFFILALFSKETALIFPFLLMLYDFSFSQKQEFRQKLFKSHLIFFLVFFVYILIRMFILNFTHFTLSSTEPFFLRFMLMLKTTLSYAGLLCLPLNLHMERVVLPVPLPQFLILIITAIIAFIFVVKSYKYSRLLFFSCCWFLFSLLPTSNLLLSFNVKMAENWLYLPSIGFFMAILTLVSIFFQLSFLKYFKLLFWLGAGFIVVFYSTLTVMRNFEWGNELVFFQNILKHTPSYHAVRVHDNLARIYYKKGLYVEAEKETKKALSINPEDSEALLVLGVLDGRRDNYSEALRQLKKAVVINPWDTEAYYNLGITYAKLGDLKKAIEMWQKTLQINPYLETAKFNIKKAKRLLYKKSTKTSN